MADIDFTFNVAVETEENDTLLGYLASTVKTKDAASVGLAPTSTPTSRQLQALSRLHRGFLCLVESRNLGRR